VNFDLSEEQTLYRDTVRNFLSARYSVQDRVRYLEQEHGYDQVSWAQLADLGVLGLPFSSELGGLGGMPTDIAIVQEEIGYHLAVEPFADHIAIPATAFDFFRDRNFAKSLTQSIVSGDKTIAVAIAEARDDSGLHNSPCRAKTSADGVVLTGSKPFVAYPSADLLLVSAAVGDATDQPTDILLLVPTDTPGVAINRYQLIDGTPAATIEFANVELPDTAIVVGTDRADRAIECMVRIGAHAAVAECLGILRRMFELTTGYMNNRVQFGKPLSAKQVVRHRLAEMQMHYELAHSVVAGLGLYQAETAQGIRQLSAAKVTTAQAFEFIGKQSIQLHGGIGLTDEYELSHYYKRALVLQDSYGSKREHSLKLARLEAA
jgi:alkylation response protein AidB-like acyl-CoA dehydrogenase